MPRAILLISCPDRKGITATVANFIYQNNGNIIHADQHIDLDVFFMRVEWSLKNFEIARPKILSAFAPIAKKFNMQYELHFSDELRRGAIFVSKHLHVLVDLLLRQREGQLACEFPLIISNHPDAQKIAKEFKTKFFVFPITRSNKLAQEKRELEILKKENIDFIILARYHQILTKNFIHHFSNRILNIHHSFLPAFVGSDPYRQAFHKGVKIIGATSHFVTEQLDEGPIIEQDTTRISHRDALEDLIRKGMDLEKLVLSRAVRLFLQHKILCYRTQVGNSKTVIFD